MRTCRMSVTRRKEEEEPGRYRYAGDKLHREWQRLHLGDRELWPDERRIAALARQQLGFADLVAARGGPADLAEQLQQAWRAFHAGDFAAAVELGDELGAPGASVANKSVSVQTLHTPRSEAQKLRMLTAAVRRGEAAVAQLPDYPNAHYMLALVLGRYSQRISILKALAEGLAGRVRTHLERTLELEPRHAEAHVAFGLYHAEIVHQLGRLAASLTYGASPDAALEHFRRAAQLAPACAIVHIEHARGLLLLDAGRYREEAQSLYRHAAACTPRDAMESLDVGHAQHGLPDAARHHG
jgi:tetratricopeptide (TPR) repeat protein